MSHKGFAPVLIIILVTFATVGGFFIYQNSQNSQLTPPAQSCTQEAKLCPDGSSVGRSGPNCEFAPCPTQESTTSTDMTNWKTYTNEKYGSSIKYPNDWNIAEGVPSPLVKTGYISITKSGIIYGGYNVKASIIIYAEDKTRPEIFLQPKENYKDYQFAESTFNGYTAKMATLKNESLNVNSRWIFIDKGQKTYIFNAWGSQDTQHLIDQILSTFKFLD